MDDGRLRTRRSRGALALPRGTRCRGVERAFIEGALAGYAAEDEIIALCADPGMGKTQLAAAIASYCRDHVPTATSASFDGEVFLDIPGKRVTATFHCNDKAATILSVRYSDGAFSVSG